VTAIAVTVLLHININHAAGGCHDEVMDNFLNFLTFEMQLCGDSPISSQPTCPDVVAA